MARGEQWRMGVERGLVGLRPGTYGVRPACALRATHVHS